MKSLKDKIAEAGEKPKKVEKVEHKELGKKK